MTEPYEFTLTQGAVGGFPINYDSIIVSPMMESDEQNCKCTVLPK